MTSSTRARKLSLVCALVLGLMAFVVTATNAATEAPEWMVATKDVTLSKPLQAELQISQVEKHLAFVSEVLGIEVEVLCTAAKLRNFKMLPHAELTHGRIDLSECVVNLNGELSKTCQPFSEEVVEGKTVLFPALVLTNKLKGRVALHIGGVPTLVLESANLEGGLEELAVIQLGEECAIGEKLQLKGKLVLFDCQGEFEVEKLEHLFEEFAGLQNLKIAGNPATLEGSVKVLLGDAAHSDMKWSGLAG